MPPASCKIISEIVNKIKTAQDPLPGMENALQSVRNARYAVTGSCIQAVNFTISDINPYISIGTVSPKFFGEIVLFSHFIHIPPPSSPRPSKNQGENGGYLYNSPIFRDATARGLARRGGTCYNRYRIHEYQFHQKTCGASVRICSGCRRVKGKQVRFLYDLVTVMGQCCTDATGGCREGVQDGRPLSQETCRLLVQGVDPGSRGIDRTARMQPHPISMPSF